MPSSSDGLPEITRRKGEPPGRPWEYIMDKGYLKLEWTPLHAKPHFLTFEYLPPSRQESKIKPRIKTTRIRNETTMSSTSNERQNDGAHKELYDAGIVFRRKVMGDAYVDNQLKQGVSEFMRPMQELSTETAWGTIWARPGLELKQRSLIVIALLASQGKEAELKGHVRGAVNNGASEIEIRETLLQTATYCGVPTGMANFRVADEVIQKLKEEGKLPK